MNFFSPLLSLSRCGWTSCFFPFLFPGWMLFSSSATVEVFFFETWGAGCRPHNCGWLVLHGTSSCGLIKWKYEDGFKRRQLRCFGIASVRSTTLAALIMERKEMTEPHGYKKKERAPA